MRIVLLLQRCTPVHMLYAFCTIYNAYNVCSLQVLRTSAAVLLLLLLRTCYDTAFPGTSYITTVRIAVTKHVAALIPVFFSSMLQHYILIYRNIRATPVYMNRSLFFPIARSVPFFVHHLRHMTYTIRPNKTPKHTQPQKSWTHSAILVAGIIYRVSYHPGIMT